MLIKFNSLFGSGPGQIPVGSTIQSARLVLTTAGLLNSTSANSAGAWAASQVLVDWPSGTHYTDATSGAATARPSRPRGPRPSPRPAPRARGTEGAQQRSGDGLDQQSIFDVTAAVQDWADGRARTTALTSRRAARPTAGTCTSPVPPTCSPRPKLVVYYTPPSATEPPANTVDLANGVLSYNGGAGL